MRIEETQNLLKSDGMRALFGKMYGQSAVEENIARYEDLVEKFRKEFGDKDILLFSSIISRLQSIRRSRTVWRWSSICLRICSP